MSEAKANAHGERIMSIPDEQKGSHIAFGFLDYSKPIEFDGGRIETVSDFKEVKSNVMANVNRDGFLYPPRQWSENEDGQKIPNSDRPARLWPQYTSHTLVFDLDDEEMAIKKGPGAFVMHLLAYLFGTRLQFERWWFDSRVPITEKARTHNVRFKPETVEHFISHCYQTWLTWSENNQKHMTNLLYMHSRAPAYEWDWESFAVEYMVTDGCYRLAVNLGLIKNSVSHPERIKTMCELFGIPTGLNDMKRNADQHVLRVKEILSEISPDFACLSKEVDGILSTIKMLYGNLEIPKSKNNVRKMLAGQAWTNYCRAVQQLLQQGPEDSTIEQIKSESEKFQEEVTEICGQYEQHDLAKINRDKIVKLRNNLFHEALWAGDQPCTGRDTSAFMQQYNLRRINQRLIPAILSYKNSYIRKKWWTISTVEFDKCPE